MTTDDASLSPDARIGTVVAERYRVDAILGRGGMGTVYRGTHLLLGEPIALKFLHPIFAETSDLRIRFHREAIALARLRHPSIVSLLDFGEHARDLFMVMELVTGQSLASLLAESAVSIPFVATMFDQLLEVLDAAHAVGIIHRDIKPSNVMVVSAERVKLLDFGLVHLPGAQEKLTLTGMVHGTPDYMSPEQCQGDATGPETDVYSTGAMLYECLAGHAPFDGRGAAELMAQHLFVEPRPLTSTTSGAPLSPALDDLVRHALAKDPARRPTAGEMRRQLKTIMSGTDPISLAEGAARERTRAGALPRSERAITGHPAPLAANLPGPAVVDLRIADSARALAIQSAVAVGIPGASIGFPWQAVTSPNVVVVSARDGLAPMERAVTDRVPVLVIDVRGVEEVTACIRAGASDVLHEGAPLAELAGRVARLVRRRR